MKHNKYCDIVKCKYSELSSSICKNTKLTSELGFANINETDLTIYNDQEVRYKIFMSLCPYYKKMRILKRLLNV